MSATYAKLRDGSWGIRVQGTAGVGDEILVTRKNGNQRWVRVQEVVWAGKDITLARFEESSSVRQAPPVQAYETSEVPF